MGCRFSRGVGCDGVSRRQTVLCGKSTTTHTLPLLFYPPALLCVSLSSLPLTLYCLCEQPMARSADECRQMSDDFYRSVCIRSLSFSFCAALHLLLTAHMHALCAVCCVLCVVWVCLCMWLTTAALCPNSSNSKHCSVPARCLEPSRLFTSLWRGTPPHPHLHLICMID